MRSSLFFSDRQLLKRYFRLIHLIANNKNRILSSNILVRLKLTNKKSLSSILKKLFRHRFLANLNSYYIVSYCLLKKYLNSSLPWVLKSLFSVRSLAFFAYHFLVLYQALFLLKMILDWFPVKNWDAASPFKRFLRRLTMDWTKQFEEYIPSYFAWIIVVNIVPILLSVTESFYLINDLACFPVSYKMDELLEYLLESNFHTFR